MDEGYKVKFKGQWVHPSLIDFLKSNEVNYNYIYK